MAAIYGFRENLARNTREGTLTLVSDVEIFVFFFFTVPFHFSWHDKSQEFIILKRFSGFKSRHESGIMFFFSFNASIRLETIFIRFLTIFIVF